MLKDWYLVLEPSPAKNYQNLFQTSVLFSFASMILFFFRRYLYFDSAHGHLQCIIMHMYKMFNLFDQLELLTVFIWALTDFTDFIYQYTYCQLGISFLPIFLSIFFFYAQVSIKRTLMWDTLYEHKTLNESLCMISALRLQLFTENSAENSVLSLRLRGHIWMFGHFFICACPTNVLHQCLYEILWKGIDLFARSFFRH